MVRPPGTTGLISQILVNPTQCGLILLSKTPIDIRGVHSRKAQDNSTTNTILGSLCATTVRWKHLVKDCVKLAKEKSRDKQKNTDMARFYKKKLWDIVWKGNITINEASFDRAPGVSPSVEQMEQLLGNLQLDGYNWVDRYPCQVTVDKVCQGCVIKYKIMVNDVPVNMLYDTGTLMTSMAKWFFNTIPIKPKLVPCSRYIAGAGGETLRPVGKCFVWLQIRRRVFRHRVVVIKNLRHKYILG